jgi:hypothetical protein
MDQNHSKCNKIAAKGKLGLFLGIFFRDEIGWVGGQSRGNLELLIPDDEV